MNDTKLIFAAILFMMSLMVVTGCTTGNNDVPLAIPGLTQYVHPGEIVQLDGRHSVDANNQPLTYKWKMELKPTGSNATLMNTTASTSTFIADQVGVYVVSLVVNDGIVNSIPSYHYVNVTKGYYPLDGDVVDAAYSDELDRIVFLSSNPDQMHIMDPNTGKDLVVPLSLPGLSVSVSPDSTMVAVGHKYGISLYDPLNGVLQKFMPSKFLHKVILLGGNGYVYSHGEWYILHHFNLSTGEEDYANEVDVNLTSLTLHPDGQSLFVFTNLGLTRMDIRHGIPTVMWGKQTDGSYYAWLSADANHILTNTGELLQLSNREEDDLRHVGNLCIDLAPIFIHTAMMDDRYAYVIPPNYDNIRGSQILIYELQTQILVDVVNLPVFAANNNVYAYDGRYIFQNDRKDKKYLIVQAQSDSDYTIPENFALVVY